MNLKEKKLQTKTVQYITAPTHGSNFFRHQPLKALLRVVIVKIRKVRLQQK